MEINHLGNKYAKRKSKLLVFTNNNFKLNIYEKNSKINIHPRLAFLIRKNCTSLMNEAIRIKKKRKFTCCKCWKIFVLLTMSLILKLTSSIFQAFIILAAILYVVGTYIKDDKIFYILEIIIILIITLFFMINFIKSKKTLFFP